MTRPGLTAVAALLACLSAAMSPAQKPTSQFQYEDFSATVYHGKLRIPHDLHKLRDGEWEDSNGHPASAPRVNFAGEYNLEARTCGTCCRYYVMTNMRTGKEVSQARMFNTERGEEGEDRQVQTGDVHTYVPVLYFKPNSNLLIVQ